MPKKSYLILLALGVLANVVLYFYQPAVALYATGMYVAGYVTKKHAAYLKAVAERPKDYVEDKLSGWFGS